MQQFVTTHDEILVAEFLRARSRAKAGAATPEDRAIELTMVARLRPVIEHAAQLTFAEAARHRVSSMAVEVKDLVQEGYTKLFRAPEQTLGRWRASEGDLNGYVYRIAKNAACDVLRKCRIHGRETSFEPASDTPHGEVTDPIARRHLSRLLAKFHEAATPAERQLFHELFIEEATPADLRVRHGWKSANSAHVWRYRLRARLHSLA